MVGTINQVLGHNDNLSGHYALSLGKRENPFDPLSPYTQLPGYGTTVVTNGQNGGISWNHIFNSRIVNEFRAGFNGEEGTFTQADKTDHNTRLGFPTVLTEPIDLGFPNVAVAGFDGIGQPTNTPQDHPTYTLHMMNNFAWNPTFNGGRHQFKVGGEFRRYFYHLLFDTSARGIWSFNGNATTPSLVQLLRGTPSTAQRSIRGPHGPVPEFVRRLFPRRLPGHVSPHDEPRPALRTLRARDRGEERVERA